jgi:hypothetical protein
MNSRYLVVVFYRLSHPLRGKLRDMGTMNMSRCYQGYSNVLSMDITPSKSLTRHELSALLCTPFVDVHIENTLAGVRDILYPLVAPTEL